MPVVSSRVIRARSVTEAREILLDANLLRPLAPSVAGNKNRVPLVNIATGGRAVSGDLLWPQRT